MQKRVKWITIAALLVAVETPRLAHAVGCDTLTNPIYVKGSSAIKPFIIGMAVPLSQASTPYTLVYVNAGSCTGPDAIINGTLNTIDGTYYTANPTAGMPPVANTCTMPAGGQAIDVGVSDVFNLTCTGQVEPATVKDFIDGAPTQAMCYAVPKASTQTALVAEEGYFVFGFPDSAGMAMPWLNNTFKFVRDSLSGTQGILAHAIGVPPNKIQGTTPNPNSNDGVLASLLASTSAESTIGFLAAAFFDSHRDTLTQLAFKGYKQYYAFYADSSPTSFDKKNVRDGHYLPWGYLHMFATVDSSGNPTNAKAAEFIKWVLGQQALPGTTPPDILDITISAHVIPACAMHVKRTADGGDLALYQSTTPCDCYFEFKATGMSPTTSTRCAACSSSTPCSGSQQCRHSYCEPR